MDPDRWQQISQLYRSALAHREPERSAFLRGACGDDDRLRKEVELLLAQTRSGEAFLQRPAPTVAAGIRADEPVHDWIGRYRVAGRLAEGGMGVVYRAHDAKLQRDVAIKILSESSDPAGRKHLLQEARAASALNHPHICTVYEVDDTGPLAFIVMEHVEGNALGDVIPPAGLPADTVLRYGLQIADALAHAHDRGIVHRDVKASNVLITPQGRAKVLDFGLAKRLAGVEIPEAITQSQASRTQLGVIKGTLAYMAPEQLRGEGADARSDVWALGVLLYEMTAGVRPFHGQTTFEISSAILSQEPAPLSESTPSQLAAVIRRCLAKEPAQRYQRAGEVRAALETIHAGRPAPGEALRSGRRGLVFTAMALAALLVGTAALDVRGVRTRLLGIPTPAPIRSLVVLPLANVSGDSDQEYFADGMTEALTSDLARLGALRVISRTSAMTYKGTRKPLPTIARELNVDAVVEGSVLRVGQRVRIVAQLIQASTDTHLWTDSYERDLQDVLRLQSDVAQAIAREIRAAVTPQERARLADRRTVKAEAYEAYLRGMFFLNKYTPDGFEKGLVYLQQAVDMDPADPFALSGLALGYTLVGHDKAEYLIRAKAAAQKAVELGEPLAQTYVALGMARLQSDWDFAGAQRDLRRAVELNPSLGEAHRGYAWSLQVVGRRDEAFAELRRAMEVEPLTPLFASDLGWQYLVAGQHDAAMIEGRKSLELNPSFPPGFGIVGRVYRERGMFDEAIAAHQKAARWLLGATYAFAGRRDDARQIAAEISKVEPGPETDWTLANVHAALGEKDEAFRRLEAAYQSRHPLMPWIRVWPELAPLRGDPRLDDLARRIGLP